MFKLKFNKDISKQELNQIEKKFKQCLKEKITPEFNVLNLCRTDVYAHVLSLFIRMNVHKILKISVSKLLDFLMDVAERYTEAPYHTFYHAADIVTILYYLCNDLSANKYLTELDVTFLMIAALCHDTGHPGFNNAFQINTKTDLALLYGNTSILENYSVDLTWKLIEKHKLNKFKEMKETLKDLILSTDMAFHNKLEKDANILFTTWNHQLTRKKKKYPIKDRRCFSRILLHAADISNMGRPWIISKQWSDLIIKEMYNQFNEEKKRNNISIPFDSQKIISLNFGNLITPFFKSLVNLLPKSHVFFDFLTTNLIQWESIEPKRRMSTDFTTITFKRIRLGFRSQSYPTVLYHHHQCKNHHYFLKDKPTISFKSSLIDDNNNTSSIVLYHPYDQ